MKSSRTTQVDQPADTENEFHRRWEDEKFRYFEREARELQRDDEERAAWYERLKTEFGK